MVLRELEGSDAGRGLRSGPAEMIQAMDEGDLARARGVHVRLAPAVRTILTLAEEAPNGSAQLRAVGLPR